METIKLDVVDLNTGTELVVEDDVAVPVGKDSIHYDGKTILTALDQVSQFEHRNPEGRIVLVVFPEGNPLFDHLTFSLGKVVRLGVRKDGAFVSHALYGLPANVWHERIAIVSTANRNGAPAVLFVSPSDEARGKLKYCYLSECISSWLNNVGLVFYPNGATTIVEITPVIKKMTGVLGMSFDGELPRWFPMLGGSINISKALMDSGQRLVVIRPAISDCGEPGQDGGPNQDYRFITDLGPPQATIKYGGKIYQCDNFWPFMRKKHSPYENGPMFKNDDGTTFILV